MTGVADARWPGEPRPYQQAALDHLAHRWAAGDRRAWVVLPPGSGKTLVGLEAARRLGRRAVVFAPNTAIQAQWVDHWQAFERPEGCAAGTDRDLREAVTVLTYQSLAVFEPDAETDEDGRERSLLRRLHPNGSALVAALRSAGPLTIVLDECHHLLQVWGKLLSEVVGELEEACVLGLTGTPADSLSAAEADLVAELFGEPVTGASIPALVREGYLAPFAELAWLTQPTPEERDYIAKEGVRFTELCTDLLSPGFASTDFLTWLRRRFCDRDAGPLPGGGAERATLPWGRLATEEPELADAVLRLHHAGLAPLPPGARLLERHRHPPRARDWMALLEDYVGNALRVDGHEPDPRDTHAVERIRAALPAIGYRLTRRGVRVGRSPVDRVLARSAAKSRGAVEILAAEAAALPDRLRGLVLCDHEHATARPQARLRGVLPDDAGSAWQHLDHLVADARTRRLAPVLVTGRTVAAAADTAADLIAWAHAARPGLGLTAVPSDRDGLVRIEGAWSSREWVRLVTGYLDSGACRVLVGTRGLLGEGWDARCVTTIVDLTTATTSTAVVQTRGRALRLAPDWPEKTAHTWTVVCVSPDHPKGAADWERFVRKHRGYLGLDADGEVTGGVAHVDAAFSPDDPPPAEELDSVNARMLARAEDRSTTRERWRIGEPYDDETRPTLRVRARRPVAVGHRPPASAAATGPPPAVPGRRGLCTSERLSLRPTAGSVLAGVGALVLVGLVAGVVPPAVGTALAVVAGVLVERVLVHARTLRTARRLVGVAAGTPDVARFGYAVADGLRAAGHSAVGAEGVRVVVDSEGVYRLSLTGAGPQAAELFGTALDEVLAPITGQPRYLVPRRELPRLATERERRRYAAASRWPWPPVNPECYHAVPSLLARNRKGARAFARGWNRWVSEGEPVYTRNERGGPLLEAWQGSEPYPVHTSSRLTWS